jgi:hypothetical protein
MTETALPMEIADLTDLAIKKADTIFSIGVAAISGTWAWKVKAENAKLTKAQAQLTDVQSEQTAVGTMISVAHELRTDLTEIKADLKRCEDSKAAMSARIDKQGEVIHDLTEAISRAMEAQGMTMKVKRPHRDDLTGA